MADDHACNLPAAQGTTLPPPWRCPECDTLWMAQDNEPVPDSENGEVPNEVTWTWRRFETLTPN